MKAQEQANTAKCLSNLRSIGQAINMYAVDNKGILVPGWIANETSGGNGIENYATILVGKKYLPAPQQIDFNSVESVGDSVFHCPSGVNVKHEVGANAGGLGNPTSKQDARGAQYWRRQSTIDGLGTGAMIDTWYGINAFDQGSGQNSPQTFIDKQKVWPFRKFIKNTTNGSFLGEYSKISKFKKSSELALMFDGLRFLDADFAKINARHNNKKITNFLFADGHAESIETKRLPRGGPTETAPKMSQAQINGTDMSVWNPWPYPKFRIDQP